MKNLGKTFCLSHTTGFLIQCMIDNLTEAFSEIIPTGEKNNKHKIEQKTRPQPFDSNFANIQLMEHSLFVLILNCFIIYKVVYGLERNKCFIWIPSSWIGTCVYSRHKHVCLVPVNLKILKLFERTCEL